MKPIRTWIVVADGARARFFLHEGIGKGLKPAVDEEMARDLPPNREIVTDKPGRSADPGGSSRHGFAPTVDYHQFEKARFARQVADVLEKARARDAFDRLVLVAPPKTLGELRQELSKATHERVHGELNKDLTHMEPKELEKPLGEVMAV